METINPNRNEKWKKIRKFVKGSGIAVLLLVAIPIIGFTSVYNIQEQEQAVLSTMGKARAVTDPGLHFKVPFIQNVRKVNTTIQGFAIGYNPNDNQSKEEDSLMITRDYNFVNVDFFVEYKVGDPVKSVYASEDPLLILQNITKSCIRTVIGSYDVDAVLTTGKNEIQSKVKQMMVEKLQQHDIGFTVMNVTIQDSEPPTAQVMEAFKAVETAKQGKETAINNANKYRNEKLPDATAQTDKILQDSESAKARRINEANADVAKFDAMYNEYMKNPEVTKKRMFYETMEEVLPKMKVIIDGTDKTSTILPLDSFVGGGNSNPDSAASGQQGTESNSGERKGQ